MGPVLQYISRHKLTLLSLSIIVPLGFLTKCYSGPADYWVHNSLGGVLYEIFWCLLLFLFLPRRKPWFIASVVLIGTSILEFLQLWHPTFLEMLRSYFIGRTVLGTSFTWSDFPHYFAGCGLGWLWIIRIHKGNGSSLKEPIRNQTE